MRILCGAILAVAALSAHGAFDVRDFGAKGYGGIEDTKTREGLEKTYLGLMEKLGDFAAQGLAGSIYTQTTDVEIEINGLLTYDRKVLKYNPEVLRRAHAEVIRRALEAPCK